MSDRIDTRMNKLRDLLENAGIEHFSAEELVAHDHEGWPGPRLYPSRERLLSNIIPTLKIADEIRTRWGGPVICVSGYRAPYYNDELVEGSDTSQHMGFRALDLRPQGGPFPDFVDLAADVVAARREEGQVIGFGRYSTFIHIDTGYYDDQRNWDRR